MTFRKELNILMLGGQSSIGQSILSKLPSNCHILATSRSNSELKVNKSGTEWINLDIANENSIELFLDEISYTSFDLIINLIGKLSGLKSKSSLKLISDYLQIYISNQTFLIERLFAINSKIEFSYINISSRAVTYGSNDLYYSEAKSAIHGLTKSLARQYTNSKCINLMPGLLKNSSMYLSMPENVRDDHERRAGGQLMEINQFALFTVGLVKELMNSDINDERKVDLFVGPQYE